jgi:hypothetical protein
MYNVMWSDLIIAIFIFLLKIHCRGGSRFSRPYSAPTVRPARNTSRLDRPYSEIHCKYDLERALHPAALTVPNEPSLLCLIGIVF